MPAVKQPMPKKETKPTPVEKPKVEKPKRVRKPRAKPTKAEILKQLNASKEELSKIVLNLQSELNLIKNQPYPTVIQVSQETLENLKEDLVDLDTEIKLASDAPDMA